MNPQQWKVALVHDWLTGMRGGEKVLEEFCQMFPEAPIFTLLHNPGSVSPTIESHPIFTSFVDRLPLKSRAYRYYLPLFPTAVEMFNLKEYDLILSTSHCVAKGVRTPPTALHIAYMHTPMRYVWDMYEDYFAPSRLRWPQRWIIPPIANYLRMWDVTSSNRVDHFIANSQHVAKRIWKYYRREAQVIYPPVDTSQFPLQQGERQFFLIVSALVPYKKVELAIEATRRLEEKLVVVGDGPELRRLQRMAHKNVEFVGYQPGEKLARMYGQAKALIFPGEEDFGIVPVEAQSCGTPVIAFGRGGALETVVGYNGHNAGKCTGIFFYEQSVPALMEAIQQFRRLSWDAAFIHRHAQQFDRQQFRKAMEAFIQKAMMEHRGNG